MNGDARHADLLHGAVFRIHGYLFHRLERAARLRSVDHLAEDGVLAVEVRLL